MLRIGLTGGIGSGKSFIARIFNLLDIPVFYSDLAAKYIMANNSSVKAAIKSLLGEDSYFNDGSINKTFIAKCIFSDNLILDQLNAIVHPAVKTAAQKWFDDQTTNYAIQESALIYEAGLASGFDHIISVSAPTELRIQRVIERDGISKADVQARMKRQWSQEKKDQLADFVIYNDTKQSLIKQVLDIHNKLHK